MRQRSSDKLSAGTVVECRLSLSLALTGHPFVVSKLSLNLELTGDPLVSSRLSLSLELTGRLQAKP